MRMVPPLSGAQRDDDAGERIGRYTIERSLARGGMAEVFLA
ncbi:MAG: hypothetical protein ACYCWW_02370 [Deltaproteobacteria bacterium]